MRPLVTLTTDFGMGDPYVAAVKGQILSRCATNVEIVDLTHEIAPGNILEGALFLAGSVPYFPKGTFHVVVIDPGVGSERHPIVAKIGGQIVVCPDNGLLSLLCQREPLEEAYIITNRDFMRGDVSATFHGRDIFAPTAGLLVAGPDLGDVGALRDTVLPTPAPDAAPGPACHAAPGLASPRHALPCSIALMLDPSPHRPLRTLAIRRSAAATIPGQLAPAQQPLPASRDLTSQP